MQLRHWVSFECSHLFFLCIKNSSKGMWGGFYFIGKQLKHFPSGPWEHFDFSLLFFLSSDFKQLRHFPDSPCKHFLCSFSGLVSSSLSFDYLISEGLIITIYFTFFGVLMHFLQDIVGRCRHAYSLISGFIDFWGVKIL